MCTSGDHVPPSTRPPATATWPARSTPAVVGGTGTPESVWTSWRHGIPDLDVESILSGVDRVLIVSPHPDDDVLGIGGFAFLLANADRRLPVESLIVTGCRDSASLMPGWGPSVALGLPTGGLADLEDDIVDALLPRLTPATLCLTTWLGDHDPDHEAVGRAVARACGRVGSSVLEFPVDMWHWGSPTHPEVHWRRARVVRLTPDAYAAKREAAAAVGGSLSASAQARLMRKTELVFW